MRRNAVPKEPGRRGRPWWVRDTRRATAAERGYDARWQRESMRYRQRHPLCVVCLLAGRVRASQCTDHIVPIHSCPELRWEVGNWAALCFVCHGLKTRKEPQEKWEPRRDRIVVCGVPGTGKTTFARASGAPYWDANEHEELRTIDQIVAARDAWIARQSGPLVIVVASPITASVLAARVRGFALHLTEQVVTRAPRALVTS